MIQSRPPLYYLILLFIITLLSFSYYKTSHKFSISSTANTKSNFNNYHDDLKTTTTKNNKLKSKIFKSLVFFSSLLPYHCTDENILSTFSRTVAIGDLHGDLPHALKVLTIAGLIDSDTNWIGGETTLVQTGDIVDRGKDTQTVSLQKKNSIQQFPDFSINLVISPYGFIKSSSCSCRRRSLFFTW